MITFAAGTLRAVISAWFTSAAWVDEQVSVALVAAFARPETSIATVLWAEVTPVPVKVSDWSWPTPFSLRKQLMLALVLFCRTSKVVRTS